MPNYNLYLYSFRFLSLMTDIMENEPSKILVFAETKRKVDQLTQLLKQQG